MDTSELRNAGLKITTPRVKILEILTNAQPRHMSAIDIYRRLQQTHADIGLATVYRVLTQFSAAGLVISLQFKGTTGATAVFELNDGQHHDHIVCMDCGKVQEFADAEIEARQRTIAAERDFEIRDHAMILYGNCSRENCTSKKTTET